ncbi:MAG: DUF2275 domain-containing protein [Nitrospirota bacterium]
MDHNDIRHKLSEYLDGSVTAEEKSLIEEHLKTCAPCSDALQELRKTVEHIKSVEEVEPPAWMTQKIMANVRAEAEEKKGLFRRLFSPLSVKLPVEAVAVLFLAVTAYYLYQNINPAEKYAKAPSEKSEAAKPASPMLSPQPEPKIRREPAAPAAKAPQAPEYKALDMKMEYEKPAPPVPTGKIEAPGPAPAKPAEQPLPAKREEAAGKRTAESQAGASSATQEQASAQALRPETKLGSDAIERRAVKAKSLEKAGLVISLMVKDVEAAAGEVERLITKLGGSITMKEDLEAKKTFGVAIDVQKLQELRSNLKLIGEVRDDAVEPALHDKRVELKIEIVASSTQP